jgi:hypothetical protein
LVVPPAAARGGRDILLSLIVSNEGPDSNDLITVVASQTVLSTPASGVNFTYNLEGYDIRGVVINSRTRVPLFAARVLLYQVVGEDEQFTGYADTDHNGRFSFNNARPATYRLAVISSRYPGLTQWTDSFDVSTVDLTVPDIIFGPAVDNDFSADGMADILWRHNTTGQVILWLMNGTARTFYASPGTVSDLNYQIQGVGDFNADGSVDILWRHNTTGQVIIWLMNGTVRTSYASPGTISDLNYQIQGVGDFNADGKADILWRHNTTGRDIIWLMNGTVRTFYASPGTVSDLNYQIQGVGDFNADGKADILWRHNTTGRIIIWLMNGTVRTFYASPGTVPESSWQIK